VEHKQKPQNSKNNRKRKMFFTAKQLSVMVVITVALTHVQPYPIMYLPHVIADDLVKNRNRIVTALTVVFFILLAMGALLNYDFDVDVSTGANPAIIKNLLMCGGQYIRVMFAKCVAIEMLNDLTTKDENGRAREWHVDLRTLLLGVTTIMCLFHCEKAE
jgi:hypothetical protein